MVEQQRRLGLGNGGRSGGGVKLWGIRSRREGDQGADYVRRDLAFEFLVPCGGRSTRSAPGDVGLVSWHAALHRKICYCPSSCL